MKKLKNLLLLSGGNDSMYIYNRFNHKNFICIYFDYGQPYKNEEIKRLPLKTQIIKISNLKIERNGYVKGRNITFLVELAKRYDNCIIWMGSNKDDIFPDNNRNFLVSVVNNINIGFKSNIKIKLPLKNKSKSEILKYINKHKLLTYSCYKGENKPCGKCKACLSIQNATNNTKSKK